MQRTVAIYDGFLKNPEAWAKSARLANYLYGARIASSSISVRPRTAPGIERRCDMLLGKKVDWDIPNGSGTFRYTTERDVKREGNSLIVHTDGFVNVSGVLYLSPPAECHGGTAFFTHKETGLEGYSDLKAVQKVMNKLRCSFEELNALIVRDSQKPSKWIRTDFVQMKFNRMILFNSRFFHSHVLDFARVKKGSRRFIFMVYGSY